MIVLCGRSCSGKDTIKKELINRGYHNIVRYTTRPIREGEVDGVDYHFVTEDQFHDIMFHENPDMRFVETECYQVANGDFWYYGTRKSDLQCNAVITANPNSLNKILAVEEANPFVFYIHANSNVLRSRSIDRGDNRDEAERRMKADDADFARILDVVDFVIKNDGDFAPIVVSRMIDKLYQMAIGLKNIKFY